MALIVGKPYGREKTKMPGEWGMKIEAVRMHGEVSSGG